MSFLGAGLAQAAAGGPVLAVQENVVVRVLDGRHLEIPRHHEFGDQTWITRVVLPLPLNPAMPRVIIVKRAFFSM